MNQRARAPEGAVRAFTELIEQTYANSTWSDSNERMFYHYDTAGRLLLSFFAGTRKTSGWSGWPGETDPGWYIAQTRAVQENIYDPAGRVTSVANYWQEYNGSTGTGANQVPTYSTSKISDGKVAYDYASTTGLRTNQKYYTVASGNWSLSRTEEYGYDSSLDYLTGVDYNDGLANEYRTWSYDAAGNRSSDSVVTGTWTYDNLNRMSASPGMTYTNDLLGNRTNRNWGFNSSTAAKYEWDVLNRAKVIAGVSTGGTYRYRADGQRIEKVEGTTITWIPDTPTSRSGHYDTNYASNGVTNRYFYDGQMGFEDDYNPSGSVTKVNRYGLGARGIDRIEHYESNTTTYTYPLYDGHGNMRAVLSKSGSSYTTGNWRTYDVWGSVRSGSGSGDPKQRYVANLGHVADDESGLTYMRARYYEPNIGRFVNEDPELDGANWYIYATNDPVNRVDASGKDDEDISFSGAVFAAIMWYALVPLPILPNPWLRMAATIFFGCDPTDKWMKVLDDRLNPYHLYDISNGLSLMLYTAWSWMKAAGRISGIASLIYAYSFMLQIALVSCEAAFEDGI